MIDLFEIRTQHEHYGFVEELLHSAFPQNERRDDDQQRWNTDNEERFHCSLILNAIDSSPVGLLTYWKFDRFLYIEHLAISPTFRGQGFGQQALSALSKKHPTLPIVLEVELPTDEQSQRRIKFYQRHGFTLWPCDYQQPPYRPCNEWFPLYLMATSGLSFEDDYEHIRKTIHLAVYNTQE